MNKFFKRSLMILPAMALVAFVGLGSAKAVPVQTFNVTVWNGTEAGGVSRYADAAHIPVITPLANFDYTGPINWFTTASSNTFGQFLNGANISNFTSSTATLATFLATSMSAGGFTYGSFYKIIGTYNAVTPYNGSIEHDDGASLYIDNYATTVFAHPDPTVAITNNFVLPAGSHDFVLTYVEANGAPSVLRINFPDDVRQVPEPGTLALFGAGLVGLAFAGRRRRSRKSV